MKNQNKPRGTSVEVRDNNVEDSGRLIDVIEGQFYEKPTTAKKRKEGAARARWLKKLKEQTLPKKLY